MKTKYRVSLLLEKEVGSGTEIVKENNIKFDDYLASSRLYEMLVGLFHKTQKEMEIKANDEKQQGKLFGRK